MYNAKVVYCGNVIEVYQYKENILENYKNKIEKKARIQTKEIKKENYNRSIKRTKEKIRHLVNANFIKNKSSFLTLTFKDNLQDYDVAFNFWKRFKQKVEYHYRKENKKFKLEYVGVVEFQERGAIHFHICLFNVPFMEQGKLKDMWDSVCGQGGVYIERIKDHDCDNVGAYITKYLTKDCEDFYDNDYKGKKRYFTSKGLKQPVVQKFSTNQFENDKEQFNFLIEQLKDLVVFEYTSKEFEIKRKEEVPVFVELEEVESGDLINIEIKKELSECVVSTQQLYYKQIILEQNNVRVKGKYPSKKTINNKIIN